MSAGGRAAREEARARPQAELAGLVEHHARARVPWLLSGQAAPITAHDALRTLRADLGREAGTDAEAAAMSDLLLDLVADWNGAHPGEEVAAPAPVVLLDSRPPAWTAASLDDLRAARAVRDGFEAAWRQLSSASPPGPSTVAGLALASALFDSACLSSRDLSLFAVWLADPDGMIIEGPDLPSWIELKERAPAAKNGRQRVLRQVSGTDGAGDYALRRLFPAPRTLALVALHDSLGGAAGPLTLAAGSGPNLAKLLCGGCAAGAGPGLRRLTRGAQLLLQARRDGPDHTMALLAARRMDSFGATPESLAAILEDRPPPGPAMAALPGAGDLPASPVVKDTSASARPGRPVSGHRAYAQLQATLPDGRKSRDDLTATGRKLTEGTLARRLEALPWGPDTPSCLRLLRDWYLALLAAGNSVNTVRRYHSTIAAALCDMAGSVPLERCDDGELEELYTLVIETDARSLAEQARLANRLEALHRFAMAAPGWGFPAIDPGLLHAEGAPIRIEATLPGRNAINHARDMLRTQCGLRPDVARAADAVLLAMSRAGLRIGEATKALCSHYEDVRASGTDPAGAVLFVRPSIFGDNKTVNAYRQVRLLAFMSGDEAEDFQEYLSYRRGFPAAGPLFGVAQRDGSFAPFDSRALGTVIAGCLRSASGLPEATSHALRRQAVNDLFLVLHETATPQSRLGPFLGHLIGWSPEERARIAEAVAPASQARDRWHAMARQFGHGAPGTSFGAYVAMADLAIFEACATPGDPALPPGLDRRHVVLSRAWQPGAGGRRKDIRGTPASPALALHQVLERIDGGDPASRAARANFLDEGFVEDRIAVARAWSSLTTNRKQSPQLRLQPVRRRGKLAPAPLDSATKLEEARALADDIIDLAGEKPAEVRDWLRATLNDATMGNAGTRLRTPADLRTWGAIAVLLRAPARWQVERVDPLEPAEAEVRSWSTARPAGTQAKLSQSKTAKSIVARVRLLRPEVVATGKGQPKGSWAGCVRLAAHLAAIWLNCAPGGDEEA
ncbi:hypothetical protein [Poseidonocella sp. HB161398]|uniref:hypothetical protein n=1 Tax=Poseidonocella sp. HB161398 TaxID=2320855 RepID=UPI001107DC71|nr:hypothetical protein [Poseidonocella sp. HB161398]